MADLSKPNVVHEPLHSSPGETTVNFAAEAAPQAAAERRLPSRFAIERLHAQGGLGRVSLANDCQLKRPVALKEIRPDRRTAETRRRFISEAEITGQLEHPGVVPIYALEKDAAGEPYYAMRFIQGRPLSDAVRDYHRRPTHLAFRELLQRFTSVCQTIAYAHQSGVLHRDLKPANVMLGEFGETLVVDWGLAKRVSGRWPAASGGSGDTRVEMASIATDDGPRAADASTDDGRGTDPSLTYAGQVMGTPAYMAPEQAAGRWDQVGAASDIYSLGAMLYVLLTGQTAVQAATAAEIRSRVQQGEFPAPRQVRAGVPRALEAVCLKAMALEPQRRYATAKELAEDIEHWLADEPVTAYAEPWHARAGRWLRKHRLLAASAAALLTTALVATSIGLVVLETERARTETARRRTANALVRVTTEEKKAQAALANETRARQQTHAALNTLTDGMLERLLTRQTQIGDGEKAWLRQVQDFYQEFAADTGNSETSRYFSADGHFRVAGIHATLGEFREAEAGFRSAIALFAQLRAEHPKELRYRTSLANCCQTLGFLLQGLGQFGESEKETRRAIALYDELIAAEPRVGRHRHQLAGSLINLGIVLGDQGKPDKEEAEYRRALKLQERLVTEEPRVVNYRHHLAKTHANLGLRIKRQGRTDEALQHFQRAVGLRKELVASFPTDPVYRSDLAETQTQLANLFRERGRRAEAEPIYREAMSVQEELAADFPIVLEYRSELAGSYTNFGALVRESGQPEACLEWFTKAIALLEPMLARDRNLLAVRFYLRNAYWGRALALDQLYRRDEALAAWDRAVELSTEAEKPQIQMPRAASLAGAGRHKEALQEANRLVQGASAEIHYDAACVHALASASVHDDAQRAEQYAARAVELLYQAKAGGLFRNPAMVAYIRTDNDLKPLRERDDFKKLLAELEMGEPER